MLKRWSIGMIVAVLAALAVAPAALAGPKGTDRPFKATMSGYAYWEFEEDDYPLGEGCTFVTTLTESPGNATHMGKIMSSWSHCPAEVDNPADGFITLAAANGDTLVGYYDYDEATEVANPDGSFTFGSPIIFTGGTGRFAGATGEATVTYGIVPQACSPLDEGCTWPWWGILEGWISY